MRAIRFAEVVVLLVDAEHPFEHQDLTIADLVEPKGVRSSSPSTSGILVANKQRMLKDLRDTAAERLAQVPGVAVVADLGACRPRPRRLMSAVFADYAIWNKRVPTPEFNRWLIEALERHAPRPPRADGSNCDL